MSESKKKSILQVLKFGSVGALNTLVDFLVLNILILAFTVGVDGKYYTFFKSISFVVAVINSYMFNKYWVFARQDNELKMKEGFLFFVVSLLGFFLNISISTYAFIFVTNSLDIGHHWGANVGALIGSVTVLVWNFIGYKLIVFKK